MIEVEHPALEIIKALNRIASSLESIAEDIHKETHTHPVLTIPEGMNPKPGSFTYLKD